MRTFLRFRTAYLAAPVLVMLALAALVLFHSLESDRLAERARQERFMRNAAFSVVDELGSELFTMVSAFSYDLNSRIQSGERITRNTLTDAVLRYRSQARFPDLLRDLACLEAGGAGSYTTSLWGSRGWVSDIAPSWASDLVPPPPRNVVPSLNRLPDTFSLDKPVLTLYLRTQNPKPGEIVAVALRFSVQTILENIVPALVRQQFSESQEAQPYQASVRNRKLTPPAPQGPVDWEVPLLPWTPFVDWFDYYVTRLKTLDRSRLAFERLTSDSVQVPSSGTGWSLTVMRLPKGIEAEMAGMTLRNAVLAVGFFLVLTLGFLWLLGLLRQARTRSHQERTFLALVSHELKTPLTVVRTLADNLSRGIGTDEARAREYGAMLRQESDRLGRMVGNVLSLTAVQGGISLRERSPVDLPPLVKDWLAHHSAQDVQVEFRVEDPVPPVKGHPAALSAAIDNLIGNAFRHGAVGPGPHRIDIVIRPLARWRVPGVELTVQDNGPGFTRGEGRSFRRPFRRGLQAWNDQRPGGGVGLSLVRVTAEALGGHLRWDSQPGRGARFQLWLQEFRP